MKRRLLEILGKIDKHLLRIHEQLQAITVQKQSSDAERQIDKELTRVPAKLDFPEAVTEYYRRQNDPPWTMRVGKSLKTILEVAAVLVAGYLAFLNWGLLQQIKKQTPQLADSADAAKRAANTAKESLVAVQRAFVNFEALQPSLVVDEAGRQTAWQFKAPMQNSGTTPTRHARVSVNHGILPNYRRGAEPELPKGFTFPDGPRLGEEVTFVLGPKEIKTSVGIQIPIADMRRVFAHQRRLYMWGWVTYNDVFDKTPLHVTMFCTEFTQVTANPTPGAAPFNVGYVDCSTHNCTDDDCDGQPGDPRAKRTITARPVTPPTR